MTKYIYHITDGHSLRLAFEQNSYSPVEFNGDSFIHCSTRKQVIPVANRFYSGVQNLYLLQIQKNLVSAPVVFENLEGGNELYPHMYGVLNLDAIIAIARLIEKPEHGFIFPSFKNQDPVLSIWRVVK